MDLIGGAADPVIMITSTPVRWGAEKSAIFCRAGVMVRFPAAMSPSPSASAGSSRVALDEFLGVADVPALLHFRTRRGVPEGLPRPDVRPREFKQRLMRHIGAEAPLRDH